MRLIRLVSAYFYIIFLLFAREDIKIWEIKNDSILYKEKIVNSDYSYVSSIKNNNILFYAPRNYVSLYDIEKQMIIKTIDEDESWRANGYEISENLKILYPANSSIEEIDFATGKVLNSYNMVDSDYLQRISLNEKKGFLATFDGGKLDVWNIKTKKKIKSIENPDCSITDICFTPDGEFIITSDRIGNIYFRDINTLKVIKQFKHWEKDYEAILAIAISPDGKYLASGGTTNKLINIWDINTGKIIKVLKGHTSVIYSLEFSPDGSKLLSASGLSDDLGTTDDKIKLWNINTGKVIDEIKVKNDEAYRAAFVGNGKHIVTWVDLMTSVRDYGD